MKGQTKMKNDKTKMDLLVSFDTTGSMYPVLSQVRREVEQFVKDMFAEFVDLRLGIIAHGDYCDKDNPYTIRVMDFTRDEKRLCEFVRGTEKTYGGDADECYELVLNTAHKELEWRDDADKLMIMIGDASPHSASYSMNKDELDWREEADKLADKGIKVFAVHALAGWRSSSRVFYQTVADKTLGVYLTLDQFNEIVDLIKATVCQQSGEEKLSEFVTIIRDSGRMTHSMENNIKRLLGEKVEDTYESYASRRTKRTRTRSSSDDAVVIKDMDELVPVMPGRFQVMTVDENCDIKGFVTANGIEFKKGRGFYELTKAETVQQYKEIIMQDRETGEMFNGSQVREKLGLQPQTEKGGVNEKLYAKDAKEFRIFVQSTSVNRKLIAGTTFLYEISDIEDTGTEIKETPVATEKDPRVKLTEDLLKDEDAMIKLTEAVLSTDAETKKTAKADKKKTKITKKSADKKSKKAAGVETKNTEFKEITTAGIDKPMVDVSKTVVKKKTVIKENLVHNFEVGSTRVLDGVARYEKSQNKKNTEYLVNNLKKSIEAAQKMLDSIQ